jgi:hypothetical protein
VNININKYKMESETRRIENERTIATVHIDDIIRYLFPTNLQHPLVAGRLISYGLYGPLDENLCLRTGPQKRNIVSDWQLDLMSIQVEREDILSIYLHKKSDMGLLTNAEQESIIAQADKHLKSAKGRAMLPVLNRSDIIELFKHVSRDMDGLMSFHDVQAVILKYRADRIENFKLVFPKLGINHIANEKDSPEVTHDLETSTGVLRENTRNRTKKKSRKSRVSSAVAPVTLFQHMKGSNNADVVQTTNRYLNLYASKITDIDAANTGFSATSNVRLLREVEPKCIDPYMKAGRSSRPHWDDTSQLTKTGLGSMVNATPSSSTWKRNVT